LDGDTIQVRPLLFLLLVLLLRVRDLLFDTPHMMQPPTFPPVSFDQDIAVGAKNDNDGGSDKGAVWILFMHRNGTVKAEQKISSTAGNLLTALDKYFGSAVAGLGDLDGDVVQVCLDSHVCVPRPRQICRRR
jgi:hypothetical protein